MPLSFRYPQIILRISLALVFLWFGLDKFIDPAYWADMLPRSVASVAAAMHVGANDLLFLAGIFEILVAVSLATGFFTRWFAGAAILFVLTATVAHGFGEAMMRDISILGGLAAIAVWPERAYY